MNKGYWIDNDGNRFESPRDSARVGAELVYTTDPRPYVTPDGRRWPSTTERSDAVFAPSDREK